MPMPGYMWFHAPTSGRGRAREPRRRRAGCCDPGTSRSCRTVRDTCSEATPGSLRRGSSSSSASRSATATRFSATGAAGRRPPYCGAVRFDHPAARNLVETCPRRSTSRREARPSRNGCGATLRLIAAEARELRPGSEAVITRLADILVVQAIRSWLETDPAAQTAGWARSRTGSRPRDRAHPPRAGAAVDRGLARARALDVALCVRCALQRAGRRAGDALRRALAHAGSRRLAAGRGGKRRAARTPARLPSEAAFARAFKRSSASRPGRSDDEPSSATREQLLRARSAPPVARSLSVAPRHSLRARRR